MGVWTWQQNNESRGGWDRLRPARGFVQLETHHGQGNRQQCWELFPPSACAYPGKNFSDLSLVLAESRYGKSLLLQSSSCPVPEASVSEWKQARDSKAAARPAGPQSGSWRCFLKHQCLRHLLWHPGGRPSLYRWWPGIRACCDFVLFFVCWSPGWLLEITAGSSACDTSPESSGRGTPQSCSWKCQSHHLSCEMAVAAQTFLPQQVAVFPNLRS